MYAPNSILEEIKYSDIMMQNVNDVQQYIIQAMHLIVSNWIFSSSLQIATFYFDYYIYLSKTNVIAFNKKTMTSKNILEKKIAENCLKNIRCFLLSDDQILNAMISQEIDGNK